MSVQPVDQLGMDEKVIEDSEAERALEECDRLKRERDAVSKPLKAAYKTSNEAAMFALERHPIDDGESSRVGRFRITRIVPEPRKVTYDPKPRLSISVADKSADDE